MQNSPVHRWLKRRYWHLLDLSEAFQLRRAPHDWQWSPVERCLDSRLDAAAVQFEDRLYIFGGFSGTGVCTDCDVLDLRSGRWVERFSCPTYVAQSHVAVAGDGKNNIYVVTGQVGNNCRAATRDAFALNLTTRVWSHLPPLPQARYAPAMQLWNGRLHLVGGSEGDRYTPASDHWSLAVSDGRAVDAAWQPRTPLPRGGCHAGSALVANEFFLFGGQQGDYVPVPGDPNYSCNGRTREIYLADAYKLSSPDGAWQRLRDMPIPASHFDFSAAVIGRSVYLCGGQIAKDEFSGDAQLTDSIQRYDIERDEWQVVATLPFRLKTGIVGHWDGWLYVATGARDRGPDDPIVGDWINQCWRARIPT